MTLARPVSRARRFASSAVRTAAWADAVLSARNTAANRTLPMDHSFQKAVSSVRCYFARRANSAAVRLSCTRRRKRSPFSSHSRSRWLPSGAKWTLRVRAAPSGGYFTLTWFGSGSPVSRSKQMAPPRQRIFSTELGRQLMRRKPAVERIDRDRGTLVCRILANSTLRAEPTVHVPVCVPEGIFA